LTAYLSYTTSQLFLPSHRQFTTWPPVTRRRKLKQPLWAIEIVGHEPLLRIVGGKIGESSTLLGKKIAQSKANQHQGFCLIETI
jgi:hypothetical protein